MQPLVIDYLRLRRAIGVLGFFLLPVLFLAAGNTLAKSISHYYYTPARDLLTGVLWAIGILLGSYRGYDTKDRQCSFVAGLAIIGVAMMPIDSRWHGGHVWAASTFFLASATLTWRFSFGGYLPRTFKALSVTIVTFLGLSFLGLPLLIAEAGAIMAFGLAWLLKGKAIEVMLGRETT